MQSSTDGTVIGWHVFPSLDFVCKRSQKSSKELSKYLHKQIWSPTDRQELLESLCYIFIDEPTAEFVAVFRPILLDIVSRARLKTARYEGPDRHARHQSFCVSLSYCLQCPDIQRFALEYLSASPHFIKQDDGTAEPHRKKPKLKKGNDVAVCRAAWLFTHHLGAAAAQMIPLGDILPFTSHDNNDVRWFAAQTVMQLQQMSSATRQAFLQKHFKSDVLSQLKIRHSKDLQTVTLEDDLVCKRERVTQQAYTKHVLLETDLSDGVTCVSGVLLSRVPTSTDVTCLDLLPVPSSESNLHSLALAVSCRSPVLLQGVVGSGKTSLVEHLARLTGRPTAPQLVKIQLGDQMDSKALLGTYRCTEVPGEFVWQPGVLTQAVSRGYWVLLEDVDYAPMDVVTLLLPLLEARCLSVPGHGDNIAAAPGFQMFATQRLLGGSSGWFRQQTGSSVLLEKLWTKVLVEPLSRQELSQVIASKHPQLGTVIDKLLDIYFLLSAGDHQTVAMDTGDAGNAGRFLSRDGRMISTRDLINWCSRIAKNFDVSSTAMGNLVFQEAVDCFVACLPKPEKRIPLAEAIGAKLNVTKAKVEFFCSSYKPNVKVTSSTFTVGRVSLPIKEQPAAFPSRSKSTFSYTRMSSLLLERVAVCVANREPVLLVGETGTGKTCSVQFLAEQLGHKLHVINMNQQSDSADLLGGFKPVDLRLIIKPFYEDFEILFSASFSRKQNTKFQSHLQECFAKRKWETLFSLMEHTATAAGNKFDKGTNHYRSWRKIGRRLRQLKLQVQQTQNALAFSFIEGSLVRAIRVGEWVLLDEINLAAMETLECLSGLLESTTGSILLMERGDMEPVVRHPDFRLFACMNPATDVGKKDLSPGIRNRFTELFVDELENSADLKVLTADYLHNLSLTPAQLDGIVKFYLLVRNEAVRKLSDGTGHPPHFSLRTLCRALKFISANTCGSVARSLYEGFCLSFLTQLDRSSHPVVEKLVCQHVLGKSNVKAILKQPLPAPSADKHLNFEGYWVPIGAREPATPDNYILTPSVRANLRDLARIVSAGRHPVLLQGETSVGKTSLITWLAQSSGNVCVRVNNHEHTDLQEYVGCYAADESGKLAFKEGVLVEAMRKGHWIILDELNLAPTDVLEALNRLLDDNRELYITETQETVRAHPRFMLFATQNPPGHYGGRKMLSRAFRNRFIELHFDEIPSRELETILHQRCKLPLSYARRLVTVMLELQTRRRGSGVFAGKLGFMTLRDLFRWAERYQTFEVQTTKFYDWDKHLAEQGYMLLAGRVRKQEEADVILEVIQKHFKCKVNPADLFSLSDNTSMTTKTMLENVLGQSADGFQHIVWTQSMRRLAVLIGQTIKYKEPVLLVGETGCGKTTVCQLYAAMNDSRLFGVNCHLHTESADFLGGLRPVRSHTQDDDKDKLFEWVDGPLVQAMEGGAMFLMDEISLADDSVLERLNSVLEPERTILLAEKGGSHGNENELEQCVAKEGFHVFATMNPGGDFGKKELSPALRNRFTEIWCPPSNRRQDLIEIIEHNLHSGIHLCNQEDGSSGIGRAIMDFVDWFTNNELGKRCTVSIRDILCWVTFINTCAATMGHDDMDLGEAGYNRLDPSVAYIHGACLVFLDSLGAGNTSQGSDKAVSQIRSTCLHYLLKQVNRITHQSYKMADLYLLDYGGHVTCDAVSETDDQFCIAPFSVTKGDRVMEGRRQYALQAPGTCVNAQRILRALQLPRPLLLEGSPGVGKTSLVAAIARAAGRNLVRINLSEQTDVTDLFGADLPVEGAEGGVFAWRDGPLLQALKAGSWVVFDELNLASQSVLEGLNACLDHRAEVYVPELGRTFHIQHESTRLFACQNPLNQGGGRKGLPRSFLNRFTQVYVEPLSMADLMFISSAMYPDIPEHILTYMVTFNMRIHEETVVRSEWGQRGSPWEFNLRDLFRWCDLLHSQGGDNVNPGEYVSLIYADRMRTLADKEKVYELYASIFPPTFEAYRPSGMFHCGVSWVQVGHSFLPIREQFGHHGNQNTDKEILHRSLTPLESLMTCVKMNWMAILVGSQSCGKSSIVQMLSSLTGNRLNILAMNSAMDTTELLGGFEQADISRHIEEVAKDVQSVVQSLCQHSLLNISTRVSMETVARLHASWRLYSGGHVQGEQSSTVEELDAMKQQVAQLTETVGQCKRVAKQLAVPTDALKQVSKLKKWVTSLGKALGQTKPGTGGGTFEWIDSLLVTSLRAGHWLLVDNVNFCSASVLDRLNALLEPHGVLSINERGVVDGQIPIITPHPDFRLFLSMDPKHGEISRAMRNRGVEIYIPGEGDGKPFSDLDLRLVLNSLGLTSKPLFDWLKNLHSSLQESLPMGDKPDLQSLLQVTDLVRKQKGQGHTLEKCLYHACYSVYVQMQRNISSRQIAQSVLKEHFDRWSSNTEGLNASPELGISPVRLPRVDQFVSDPVTASIARNTAMFTYLVEEASQKEQSDVAADHVKHGLCLALDHMPADTVQYTIDWLQNYSSRVASSGALTLCKLLVDSLPEMYRHVKVAMAKMDYNGVVKVFLAGQTGGLLSENAIDLQWNQQALQRLVTEARATGESRLDDHRGKFITMCNRLHVLQFVLLELLSMKGDVETLQTAIQKETDQGRRSRLHPSIVHLALLYPAMERYVVDQIPCLHVPQYHNAVQVLEGLRWFKRLLAVAAATLSGQSTVGAGSTSLHWKWFYNRTLPVLVGADSAPQQLLTVVNKLQEILGKDESRRKIFVKFWRSWGHPAAYRTQNEARVSQQATTFSRALNIHQENADVLTTSKVKVIVSRRQFLVQKFKILYSCATSENIEDTEETEKALQLLLHSFGIHIQPESMMETDSVGQMDQSNNNNQVTSLPVCHTQLWPMFEMVSIQAGWKLLVALLQSGRMDNAIQSLVDFCEQCTPIPLADLYLYKELKNGCAKELLCGVAASVFANFRRSTAVCGPLKWLQWDQGSVTTEVDVSHPEPSSVHQAALSFVLFHLLSRADSTDNSKSHNVKLNASLQTYKTELDKLSQVSRHVWSHVAMYGAERNRPSRLEKSSLLAMFDNVMTNLKPLLPSDIVPAFSNILEDNTPPVLSVDLLDRLMSCIQSSPAKLPADIATPLDACIESVKEAIQDDGGGIFGLGVAWVRTAQLLLALQAPKGPVDPVEKQAIKLDIVKEELLENDAELEVRCMHHRLLTGQELTEMSPSHVHPRIPYLLQRSCDLGKRAEELANKLAYRPSPSQYGHLVSDVDNYLSSVASPANIDDLLGKLHAAYMRSGPTVLQQVALWGRSHERFVQGLETEFGAYRDITAPFIAAVQQLLHGVHLLAETVKQRQVLRPLLLLSGSPLPHKELTSQLEKLVISVGKFPTVSRQHPGCLSLAMTLTSDPRLTMVKNICASYLVVQCQYEQVLHSILNSSLEHLQNGALVRQELTSDLVSTLNKVLAMFMLSWQQAEQQRREKEEEEKSLYRYKSQVHGDERTEEERLEAEFRENFPLFDEEFLDLVEATSLDDTHIPQIATVTDSDTPSLTDTQMAHVANIHTTVYRQLVHTDWLRPDCSGGRQLADWIQPVLTSYTAAASLGKTLAGTLSSEMDGQLLGSHLVVSRLQQLHVSQGGEQVPAQLLPEPETYDIYHDANVPEVIECVPVLHGLVDRVHGLLEQWPDHPTLKQLCDIVARIESLLITTPVMKFLTGVELLVHKAQDWESNASQQVSLATQLADMSNLIIRWRKLELRCWSNALDMEVTRCRQRASRWWFHMYQLIQSLLHPQDEDEAKTDSDVIKTMKQFMEQSTLGEYETRLDILLAFHCHLVMAEATPKREMMMNVLWNLHQFYSRFLPVVNGEITRLRTPVEKEMKGFVKIARWSDINYWALKKSTEKTHRTLHKRIKKFQVILQQPVRGILGDMESGASPVEVDASGWCDGVRSYEDNLVAALSRYQPVEAHSVPECLLRCAAEGRSLQCRLPVLSVKYNKHWLRIVQQTQYGHLAVALDQFTGELIDAVHEMQALEVSKSGDRDKQRSEAKHINIRKRTCLSELFRYLTKLGLSYRKGLVGLDSGSDAALLVPPLDIGAAVPQSDQESCESSTWVGCQHYYYRCISRRAQFIAALASPSKELGVGNIERCRGFTEHLFKLLVEQYTDLSSLSTHVGEIRRLVSDVERLGRERTNVLPQQEAHHWLTESKDLVVQVTEGLSQFLVLLHCCPGQQGQVTVHPSPYPVSELHQMALVSKGDHVMQEAIQSVQCLLNDVEVVQKSLARKENRCLIWEDVGTIEQALTRLSSCIPTMQSVAKLFSDPVSDQPNAFNEVLYFLSDCVHEKCDRFTAWLSQLENQEELSAVTDTEIESFSGKVENLIASMLMAVQRLKKQHSEEVAGAINGGVDGEEDGAMETELRDGHLAKHLHGSLKQDLVHLDCQNILLALSDVIDQIVSPSSSQSAKMSFVSIVYRCVPLLQQYGQTVHYHLVSSIATERTLGKLLSVLLGVFTDLALKGFCIPAEFSDELEQEGATDFADIEGGGIGEGEGVKDVSDQIETEDQLEEAKRPEDYNKEDNSEQPNIKSEENAIEMSEDVDGKLQDLEDVDKEEDDDSGDDKAEDELERQMGDVDEQDTDKLDEQMWGSDDEGGDNEEAKEETGPGDGKQGEEELVAKDDNSARTDDKDGKSDDHEDNKEESKEDKINNLDNLDQDNYDDDHVDPYHGDDTKDTPAPDDLELPDDLNLDNGEDNDGGGEEEQPSQEDGGVPEDTTTLPAEEAADNTEDGADDTQEMEQDGQDKEDNQEGEKEDERQKDEMETDGTERQEEEGDETPGFTAEDESGDVEEKDENKPEADDSVQPAEQYGKTSHDVDVAEQSEGARDEAGQADNEQEVDGTGQASSEQMEGHEGQRSSRMAETSSDGKRKKFDRQPGKSDADRSLGSTEQNYKKLKTTDSRQPSDPNDDERQEKQSDVYEHIKDSTSHHDAQTLDVANAEQQEQQGVRPHNEESDTEGDAKLGDDDEEHDTEDLSNAESIKPAKLKDKKSEKDNTVGNLEETMETDDPQKYEIAGERVTTDMVARGPDSTIHTAMEHLYVDNRVLDLESLRAELESQLGAWNQSNVTPGQTESTASDVWHRYEALTSGLSQELCEQLRLVLEPSQATKLKGDYRTGKRLNMRKVIPYIASQFRKDKIWLRRTKPSKRQYQIMLAIDDSSSMVDNHSKQLAFESLALVANALTLLEAGELAICSFGESVDLLHPFTEQFTSQSGAHLLQYLTFEQKKTKIAQLMQRATSVMLEARSRQRGTLGSPETSQLLLIVSDGRGLFLEGMDVVKDAVRQARETNVFIVFVVLDNPLNKDSILDIKVPIFKQAGQIPEIKSYMDSFPFPFYIILRDINSLPMVLSDALRQWFELVTAVDR